MGGRAWRTFLFHYYRKADARSVDQSVTRLESAARPGCIDPHTVLHDFPVLGEAWASGRPES
jgi:hypothetical protein